MAPIIRSSSFWFVWCIFQSHARSAKPLEQSVFRAGSRRNGWASNIISGCDWYEWRLNYVFPPAIRFDPGRVISKIRGIRSLTHVYTCVRTPNSSNFGNNSPWIKPDRRRKYIIKAPLIPIAPRNNIARPSIASRTCPKDRLFQRLCRSCMRLKYAPNKPETRATYNGSHAHLLRFGGCPVIDISAYSHMNGKRSKKNDSVSARTIRIVAFLLIGLIPNFL